VKARQLFAPVGVLALGVGIGPVALGQQAATNALEEIIVTAQKRAESVQETPVSVTALTPEDLESKQILTMEGLKQIVPGLFMEQALSGTTTPKMFLRGVGVDNQVFSFESPIGLYVDGVYIARVTGALTDLYDVDRVEFLRGPQGTLYGRNSSVGALNIWRRLPSLTESRFSVGASYGTWDQLNGRFHASGPIVDDKLAAGITATYRRNDGWMTDVTTGLKAADEDVLSVRASALWQASDALSVIFRADMMRDHSFPTQASNFLINPDLDLRTYESSPGSGRVNQVEPKGLSATIDWNLGLARLTSVTAYRELTYKNANDVDGRAAVRSFEVDRQDLDQDQFTQEVYLAGDSLGSRAVKWTVGAFYLLENNNFNWALHILAPPTTQEFDQKTDSEALYAQAVFPVSDKLNFTAGLRQTWESKDFKARQFAPTNTVPTQNLVLNPAFQFADTKKATRLNWRAAIDYAATDTVMLYANAGTGFRSGGFNGSSRDIAGITSGSFGPESTFMTEAGFKSEFLDRRLRLNTLYYYSDYKNLQQSIVQPNGSILSGNVTARTQGVELEITAAPVEGLLLTGSLGQIDQNIKDSTRKLKDSPKLQWRAGATYGWPVGSAGGSFSLGADVAHSDRYFNDTNNAPGTETSAYSQWNSYASYWAADRRWGVTLTGYNLTDEDYPNHTFNIANGFISSVKFPVTPRRWLLSIDFNF
jgi:iron complex outermembrane receptor protein